MYCEKGNGEESVKTFPDSGTDEKGSAKGGENGSEVSYTGRFSGTFLGVLRIADSERAASCVRRREYLADRELAEGIQQIIYGSPESE